MAMIIVRGRLLLLCKLLDDVMCRFYLSKYISKLAIASGMMSSKAMERKSVPEKVIATLITEPYLKHFMPEINLPNTIT